MSRLRTTLTRALLLPALLALVGPSSQAAEPEAVMRLLDQKRCEGCRLQDADLVQADLRDARLQGAQLQRANLSGTRLDGADLRGADLSFTSLAGASLRGANLQGSRLEGTDLRDSDLTGALMNFGALERSHWQRARGIISTVQSYAELHNAGVTAGLDGHHVEAEAFFSQAIQRLPTAAVSWTARGISRAEQGNLQLAAQDLTYAGQLYAALGDTSKADALKQAAQQLMQPTAKAKAGNGMGSALLGGAMAAFRMLAPIAAKAVLP